MPGLKRFYYNVTFSDELIVEGEVFNHLKNVLRCTVEQDFLLYNEKNIARYRIKTIDKKRLKASLLQEYSQIIPDYSLHVYLAVMKNRYMDNIIQKLGEIGITGLTPVYTENSTARINEKTYQRYKSLLIKGALQAEMDFLPVLDDTAELANVSPAYNTNLLFVARGEGTEIPLVNSKNVSLFFGPEGGFTDNEITLLSKRGFMLNSPTSSVLKAETAAVVFAGMIKILMENLNV